MRCVCVFAFVCGDVLWWCLLVFVYGGADMCCYVVCLVFVFLCFRICVVVRCVCRVCYFLFLWRCVVAMRVLCVVVVFCCCCLFFPERCCCDACLLFVSLNLIFWFGDVSLSAFFCGDVFLWCVLVFVDVCFACGDVLL